MMTMSASEQNSISNSWEMNFWKLSLRWSLQRWLVFMIKRKFFAKNEINYYCWRPEIDIFSTIKRNLLFSDKEFLRCFLKGWLIGWTLRFCELIREFLTTQREGPVPTLVYITARIWPHENYAQWNPLRFWQFSKPFKKPHAQNFKKKTFLKARFEEQSKSEERKFRIYQMSRFSNTSKLKVLKYLKTFQFFTKRIKLLINYYMID